MSKHTKHKMKVIAKSTDATSWSRTSVNLCGATNKMKLNHYHQPTWFWKDVTCDICLELKPLTKADR